MSQTAKIVLGIVVLLVVLGVAYYFWHGSARAPETGTPSDTQEVTTLPSGGSSSDTAIDEDLHSIDTQIQQVGTDNANASESVDTAVSAQ